MVTILFGPYHPQTIAQMNELAKQVSSMSPSQCRQVLNLLDLAASIKPETKRLGHG